MLFLLAMLLAGCGLLDETVPLPPFTAPPPPVAGATPDDPFYVVTANYAEWYTAGNMPFDPSVQFTSAQYPIPVAYVDNSSHSVPFPVRAECEQSIRDWAQADPRVCVISGSAPNTARIIIFLQDTVSDGAVTDILGMTKWVRNANPPHYELYLAALDPATRQPLPLTTLQKTLTHELGHVFGLGHSTDERDLMYFKATPRQGSLHRTFLTLGDALAIWTTLNYRRIDWVSGRPPVTPARSSADIHAARQPAVDGQVVCSYRGE